MSTVRDTQGLTGQTVNYFGPLVKGVVFLMQAALLYYPPKVSITLANYR